MAINEHSVQLMETKIIQAGRDEQGDDEEEWVYFSNDHQPIFKTIRKLEKDTNKLKFGQKLHSISVGCLIFPSWFKSECLALISLGWALALNSFLLFLIPAGTTFAVGHLGKDELAASGLAQSFCNVTGMVFGAGFVRASDTLSAQAYGAGNYRKIGIVAQRAFLITTVIMCPIIALWINAEKILLGLGQDPTVVRLAAQFVDWFIPALILYIIFNIVIRYLACQSLVKPLVYAAVFATVVDGICCYLFIYYFNFGLKGAALAIDMAYLSLCAFLLIYFCFVIPKSDAWQGWSWESLAGWKEYVYLGFPSMAMLILEWSCFEFGVVAIGTIGAKQQATQIALYFVAGLIFFVSFGIAMGTGVRVGHFLGAGQPIQAQRPLKVGVALVAVITFVLALLLVAVKDYVGYLFTSDSSVIAEVSKTVFIVGIVEFFDAILVVENGGIRGAGLQKYGALANLFGYLCIANPGMAVLIFVAKMEVIGFWTAMIISQSFQVILFGVLLYKSDWNKLSREAKERAGILQESMSLGSRDDDKIKLVPCEENKYDSVTDSTNIRQSVNEDSGDKVGHYGNLSRKTITHNKFVDSQRPSKKLILSKVFMGVFSLSILIGGIFVRIYI